MSRLSPEGQARLAAANARRVWTPEMRAAMSVVMAEREFSPEHRERISRALRGRMRSPEHAAKLGLAHRGKTLTPNHRAQLVAANMGNTHARTAPVKGECVYCFGPATTRDHVIPRGRPGWDDLDNVVPCCVSCNAAKKDRTPDEWFAETRQAHGAMSKRSRSLT